MLDFFLSKHEKYLSRVKDIFNSLDANDDGVIDSALVREAVGYIDPMNELKLDADTIRALCDPNGTGLVPFSKYIQVLSSVGTVHQIKVKNHLGEHT